MSKRLRFLLLSILFLLGAGQLFAKHLMGGDLTYKYLGNNKYALQFLFYRDCNGGGAALSTTITYRIYPGTNVAKKDYTTYTTRTISLQNGKGQKVDPTAPGCVPPTGVCAEVGVYKDTISLGSDTAGYHITFYQNERNLAITNIVYGNCVRGTKAPFGLIWYVHIPPNKYKNSSPQFNTVPLNYICSGRTSIFTYTATDPDKDSLVYSLVTPFSPGPDCTGTLSPTPYPLGHSSFQTVTYASGYSITDPFGNGSTSISIDKNTGEITANPSKNSYYVIALQVDEYRVDPVTHKATYLGFVRRDLQIITTPCSSSGSGTTYMPTFIKDTSGTTKYVNPGDSICFTVYGQQVLGTDTLSLTVFGGIFSTTPSINPPYATTSIGGPYKAKANMTICWAPTCDQITYSTPYTLTFALSDRHCNTTYKNYQLYVRTRPILPGPKLRCANVVNDSTVTLTFSDTSKPAFQQYNIWRDTSNSGNFVYLDSLNSQKYTSYTDKTARHAYSRIYSYYITAENTCGLNGAHSDTLNTVVPKYTRQSDKKVTLTWNAAANYSEKYKLYIDQGSGYALVDSTFNTSYSIASCSKKFSYKIRWDDTGRLCQSYSGPSSSISLQDKGAPDLKDTFFTTVSPGYTGGPKYMSNIRLGVNVPPSDSADASMFYIERSTDNKNFSTIASGKTYKFGATSQFVDSTVNAAKTRYYYRIRVADSCGNTTTGKVNAPVFLQGTAGQYESILNWKNYLGKNIYGISLYRGTDSANLSSYKVLSATDTAYNDTGLTCGKTYYYQLHEFFYPLTGSQQLQTVSDYVKVTPVDTVKPKKLTINYVTASSGHTITVNWTKAKERVVKKYILLRKASGSSSFTIRDTITADTFYVDKKVHPQDTSYCYEVQSMDSCSGALSPLSSSHCSVYLQTSKVSCYPRISLNWTAYNGWTTGVSKYEIYRITDNGLASLVGSTSGTIDTFTDNTVSSHHMYRYYIMAYQKNGSYTALSDSSVNNVFTPQAPYIQYASKTITSATAGQVVIRWATLLHSPHIKFSRLYYRAPGSSSYTLLKDNILPGVDSFVHSGLDTRFHDHSYYMISYDSCGNVSDTSLKHTTMNLSMTIGQLVHDLKWTPYRGWDVEYYVLQIKQGTKYISTDTVPGADTAAIRFPAPCNRTVTYRVEAVSFLGDKALSDTASGQAIDSIPSNAPVVSNATIVNTNLTKVNFKGADSSDTYGYAIMRSDNGGNFNSLAFVPYNGPGQYFELDDTANTIIKQHCYVIVTLDSCLNASPSDTFCTIHLAGTALNEADSLEFSPFAGYKIKNYDLQVLKNNTWKTLTSKTAPKDTAYLHTPLACFVPQYYRVVAYENGGSRTTTSDSIKLLPFDTIIPPAPVLRYATAIPGVGYKLEWSWDKASDVKYFEIWRKDSTAAAFKMVKLLKYDSTYTDPVTPVNGRYAYYVIAIDSCNSAHRSPASQTNRTMQVNISTRDCKPLVRLKWTAYLGLPNKPDRINILRNINGGLYSLLTQLSDTATGYTDTSVTEGTRYGYRIQAVDNKTGYYSYSDTISISPFVYPLPKQIQIIRATVVKTDAVSGSILVEWNNIDPTDLFDAGYRLYYATQPGGPFTLLHDEGNLPVTAFLHTGINTLTGHFYYYIAPYNICGREAQPSGVHQPVNMQINNGNLSAGLVWTAYRGFTVDHYEIYKALPGGGFVKSYVVPNTDTVYNDTNIYCGKHYAYEVVAVSSTGIRATSDSITIAAMSKLAPAAPKLQAASVTATSPASGSIQLILKTAGNENRRGYVIYHSKNGSAYAAVDSFFNTASGAITYLDKNIDTKGSTYSYYLRTVDSCGNISAPSDTQTVMHLVAEAKNNQNVLTWSDYYGFHNWVYHIQRKVGVNGWADIGVVPNLKTNFQDTDVHCHVLYEYRIEAVDTLNNLISYSNTDTATAFEDIPPVTPTMVRVSVKATSSINGKVLVQWTPSTSEDAAHYVIYRTSVGGAWVQAAKTNLQTTYVDSGLNTYDNIYYYKIRAIDSCGNYSDDNSGIHRTINLHATPGNSAIKLTWNTYRGYKAIWYALYRNDTLQEVLDSNVTALNDTMVLCTRKYSYYIIAYGIDSTASYSNRDSTQPKDYIAPQSPYLIYTTVSLPNHRVDIKWRLSPSWDVAGYTVYKRIGDDIDMRVVQQSLDPLDSFYSDEAPLNALSVCYKVVAIDHCGNTSDLSNMGCTINVSGEAKNLVNTIAWNPYQDWPDKVDHYNIYRKNDSNDIEKIATVKNTVFSYKDTNLDVHAKDFCYLVEAIEKGGFYAKSMSTELCLNQPPIIWIANAFTPNTSLGLNDQFGPQGAYIARYSMKIFNRWGEEVYNTNDSKPWSGYAEGKAQMDGIYYYMITAYGYDGTPYSYKGNVMLLK
jgi:fibronectin type 3 domain-containing protein